MSDVPPPPPPPPGPDPTGGPDVGVGPDAVAAPRPPADPSPTSPPPTAPSGSGTSAPTAPPPQPDEVGEVPELDDRQRPLDPRVIPLWRLSTALSTLFPGAIVTMAVAGFLGRTAAMISLGVVLVLAVVLAVWYPPAKYARWRWRLTDLSLELHHGVWVRRTETLPYFRIQQIDVNQGPIDRLLDLASLEVTSASASGSVSLPGIPVGDAPAVRRALLERASQAAASDDGDGLRDAV